MRDLFKVPLPPPKECERLRKKYGTLRRGLEEWYRQLKAKLV